MLRFIGRKSPFIQATDPDKNQRISLYEIVDVESQRNQLVPLCEHEYHQYNSLRENKTLGKTQLHYENGRKDKNGSIMGQDIERKILVLECLCDTMKETKKRYNWILDRGVYTPNEKMALEKIFRKVAKDAVMNAQKILHSLNQDYPQLFEGMDCMESLKIFQGKVQVLAMQVTREKHFWEQSAAS